MVATDRGHEGMSIFGIQGKIREFNESVERIKKFCNCTLDSFFGLDEWAAFIDFL